MIEIRQLQKIAKQGTALDIDQLIVETGEVVAIVGPADSGKELLFDLFIGRTKPSRGTLHLAGVEPADSADFSRLAGILFPHDGLYARLSPLANLVLQCRLYAIPKALAREMLARIGMADQASAKLDKLPSGLQRRLAFGRCILHNPRVLILYEPFARCDETSIQVISNLVRQEAETGSSVLVLADDTTYFDDLCDRIFILNLGRLTEFPSGEDSPKVALPFKIPVRLDDKVRLVNPVDILYVETDGNYTRLHTLEMELPTRFTLTELEERLSRSGFFRAHRAYLVNLQHVKEVIPYTRNSYSLRLADPQGTEIPLSRSAASELRTLLGY